MQIEINVGGPLAEAINNLAAALVSAKQADTVIEKASSKARAKKSEQVVESAEATTTRAPAETNQPAPTATETTAATESVAPSREDARKAILKVAKEKGHDAAAALLKQFGASKISEVKDEDIAGIIKAAEAL